MEFYNNENNKENNLEEKLIEEKVIPQIKKRVNQYAQLSEERKEIELEKKSKLDEFVKDDTSKITFLVNEKETIIFAVNEIKYYIDKISTNKLENEYKKDLFEKNINKCIFFFRTDIQKELGEQLEKEDNIRDVKYQTDKEDLKLKEYEDFTQKFAKEYSIEYKKYIGVLDNNKIIKIENISDKIFEDIYSASFAIVKENPCEDLNLVYDKSGNIIAIKGDLQKAEDRCIDIVNDIVENLSNINCNKSEQLEYALEIIKFQYNIASQINIKNNVDKALKNYNNTLNSIEKVFENSSSIGVLKCSAECHNRIAELYEKKRKQKIALQEMEETIKLRKEIIKKFEDKNIKFNNMNIKVTRINDVSLDSEKDALIDDYLQLSRVYYNLYKKYRFFKSKAMDNMEQATAYSDKVLKIRTEEHDKKNSPTSAYNLILALNNNAEKKEKNVDIMWKYYEKSLDLYNNIILNSDDIETLRITVDNLDIIYNIFIKSRKLNMLSSYMDKLLEQIKYVSLELNNVESLMLLSTAFTKIGTIYCEIGEIRKGVEISKDGIQLLQKIVAQYPDQVNLVDKFRLIAKEEEKLAKKLESTGNKEEAMQHYMVARALLNNLILTSNEEGLEDELKKIEKHLRVKFGRLLNNQKVFKIANNKNNQDVIQI